MTITLHIPDDAAADLCRAWGDNLDRAALEAIAVEGYRSGKLSLAQVGRLLGFDNRWDTEAWLGERGVACNYSLDDLQADRLSLDRVLGKSPQ